ncbi:hypothetical protein GCM10011584_05070 [Nocardioides phosphati]|uniref:Uncharacterized protein n=1 Tax=Nocardioides phosphati TaxID=1867775 RepID=A0ABQ2N6V0_9ACTN|nr:hypothetical protein [Nocardioides phosphati]GGO85335.1 hypothetical protein GCM10011584_05070 [Nocardioides phosphati]
MSDDDATLRALEERATPGPWTPAGDKIHATAADALIPDNILVAYYTGHDHRLGLKTTGHAADVEFMAASRTALPDRLDRLDRIRVLHAKWGEQSPEDADGYLDLWETLGRLLDGEPA